MNDQEMSVVEHLGELRKRLIITALSFLVFLIVGFSYTKEIYQFIVKDLDMKLTVLGPSDILWIYFVIAAVFSIVCTIPIAALQLWLFVKPALLPHEQRATILYIPALFLLFIGGLCFGYFIILPFVLQFLIGLGSDMFQTMFTTEKYFSFVMNMTVPFAVIFELPVIAMFLTSIGILNPVLLQQVRRYAYFVLIVIAVCITPPDFVSDFAVAIPLLVIYELSITVSKFVYNRKLKKELQSSSQSASV
ncbi:preprotein translocase subunit TatC [Bacillus manliponensis]|uniref:Sec-independent protein translocase protein TatC n=1 Tax=Bacillus manliponensis TaxID=574376 RepID=A0A073K7U9_9BACI|nr:twin-arginine translocase subunit TatC [Bacillus manliponensis]KEK18328.1 preprotein translocase subunit TatC [Bacillus manliponensis]